jgi:hypothetical protein
VLDRPVDLQISAVDASPSETLRYHAVGLPVGLSIDAASGVISGSPTVLGRTHVTVTVSDSVDAASVKLTWTVKRH